MLKGRRVTFRRQTAFFKARFTTAPRFLSPTGWVPISLSPSHSDLYFFHSQGINEEVGKVSATDYDSGKNGEVEYQLLYAVDVNSKFAVNQNTGSITTLEKLDFEQIRQHTLYIRAADQGFPSLSSKLNHQITN